MGYGAHSSRQSRCRRGTLGPRRWPGAFSHAGPLTLRDLFIELATAAARRRGGSAIGRSVHVSPSRLLGAAYRHTLPPHNKACTPSERCPGVVAPGRCDAPIPRPHSPAPAGAEGRELFPSAAWRHRSRSTPWRPPRPRRRWPQRCQLSAPAVLPAAEPAVLPPLSSYSPRAQRGKTAGVKPRTSRSARS